MRIQAFHLKRAGAMSLAISDNGCLTITYGEGGGCTLEATGASMAACVPLRGSLQVQCAGLDWVLTKSDALTAEADASLRAVGRGNGRWLAVLGGKQVWELGLSSRLLLRPQLLPNLHRADHDLRHLVIAVARAGSPLAVEGAVNALMDKLALMQEPLQLAIARCPGRTWLNKRQVFLRLQRVHNHMCANCDRALDIETLARMANYSPCHFLRIFHTVYQTTPHAYLLELRLQRARMLLRSSSLAVTEVAVTCGFENRSAFSRLFRERFGTTAQETKRAGRPRPDLSARPEAA